MRRAHAACRNRSAISRSQSICLSVGGPRQRARDTMKSSSRRLSRAEFSAQERASRRESNRPRSRDSRGGDSRTTMAMSCKSQPPAFKTRLMTSTVARTSPSKSLASGGISFARVGAIVDGTVISCPATSLDATTFLALGAKPRSRCSWIKLVEVRDRTRRAVGCKAVAPANLHLPKQLRRSRSPGLRRFHFACSNS